MKIEVQPTEAAFIISEQFTALVKNLQLVQEKLGHGDTQEAYKLCNFTLLRCATDNLESLASELAK